MSDPIWTGEPPKEEDWYWWRYAEDGDLVAGRPQISLLAPGWTPPGPSKVDIGPRIPSPAELAALRACAEYVKRTAPAWTDLAEIDGNMDDQARAAHMRRIASALDAAREADDE